MAQDQANSNQQPKTNNRGSNNNTQLKPPPDQTVPGVVIYHCDPEIDRRIREVRRLKEAGYEVDTIAAAVGRNWRTVLRYYTQIQLAQLAYIKAFPYEFDSSPASLHQAIVERQVIDNMLRRELAALERQANANPSNKVGIYKLIMRNLRETEELSGLLITQVKHSGSVSVKDDLRATLDAAPPEVREAYLDALSAVVSTAEQVATAPRVDTE